MFRIDRLLLALIPLTFIATALVPSVSATAPARQVLAIDFGIGENLGGLDAAGIHSCASATSDPCYVQTSPLLGDLSLAPYSAIYVGWDEAGGASFADLNAYAAQIATFVSNGGGVLALSESPGNNFAWVPLHDGVQSSEEHADDVHIAGPGLVHPMFAGLTDNDMSGWGNSRHNWFSSYTGFNVLASDSTGTQAVTIEAGYGSGCVVLTGQDPDFHGYYDANGAAQTFLRQAIDYVTACSGAGSPVPTPELPTLALVGAGLVGVLATVGLVRANKP